MKIGLIDVDGHNFPNLPLMKLSAYHKKAGDRVDWYNPLIAWQEPPDRVYMSKVFTFTPDYPHPVNAMEIIKSGTGYYYPDGGIPLPQEIEHIYPDYSLYPDLCKDTAYGFLTRGCPRGCDIRIMTPQKAEYIKRMKIKQIHFAWDKYTDKKIIIPKFRQFKEITGWDKRKMSVYVLVNFNTSIEQGLDRIYTLRDLGYWPYVMIYDKDKLPKRHIVKHLQRWVNNHKF